MQSHVTCPNCGHEESNSVRFHRLEPRRFVQFGRDVLCPNCGTTILTGSLLATGLLQIGIGLVCVVGGMWIIIAHFRLSNAIFFGVFILLSLRIVWSGALDTRRALPKRSKEA